MKVAIVSPYDLAVPGGVQAHVDHLATALRAGGDEVEVVGPRRSMKVRFNGSVAPIGLQPSAGRWLRAELAAARPDVIHVHEPLVPFVGMAAARSRLAPVVATFHAWSERDRAYRLARPIGRRLVRGLDDLLAVSEAAAGYHAGGLGVPRETFTIVPNGVDVARFSGADPFPALYDPDRPMLLFVGRLEPRKGLETLVRAYGVLKGDRRDLRLVVVGDGAERARCQQLLPASQRADVMFMGRVANEDLPGIYVAADVYVSPALGGESFGIVLLEAMAAGTPVVASDIPGYRSVVTDGQDGKLVPPHDPAALAQAIGSYLDDPVLRSQAAEIGRRTAARYDWPIVAQQVRARYLAVL